MKKLFLIPTAVLFSFCSTNKEAMKKEEDNKTVIKTTSPCPSDGVCTTEILKNKSLVIKTDEFGSIYTQTIDSETTSVIVYQYNRTVKGDLQDAGYREELIFEINNNDTELNLTNKELQQTKMYFGRFCFCRGQTGYYKVEEGKLNLNKVNNTINLNLDFTITKVPQIIKTITTSIN
jgi:hypothetical protein